MYGYVVIDKPDMFVKDFALYRAFYCGYCKSVGKKCSQLMRMGSRTGCVVRDPEFTNLYKELTKK